jgi:hypothetical protein
MALASVKARLNGEDPLKKIERDALQTVQICHRVIGGLSNEGLQVRPEGELSDVGPSAIHTPDFASSTSEISFDPLSMLTNNAADFSPLDFNSMFDTSYYRMPDLWDPDFLALAE